MLAIEGQPSRGSRLALIMLTNNNGVDPNHMKPKSNVDCLYYQCG